MVNWKPVKEAITPTEDSVVPDGVWSGGAAYGTGLMAHARISRIEIHADKSISVSLRWQDEFQKLVQVLEAEGGAHHDKC